MTKEEDEGEDKRNGKNNSKSPLDEIKLSDDDNRAISKATRSIEPESSQNSSKKTTKIYVNTETDVNQEHFDPIKQQDVQDRIADRELREKFGDKAYNVVRKTLYGWGVILFICAFCKLFFDKNILSDNVLMAITTAVTLNTFAAFLGVIRGLFPSNKVPTEQKEK